MHLKKQFTHLKLKFIMKKLFEHSKQTKNSIIFSFVITIDNKNQSKLISHRKINKSSQKNNQLDPFQLRMESRVL